MSKLKFATSIFLIFLLTTQKCESQAVEDYNLDFEEWVDSSFINSTVGIEPPFEVEGRALGRMKKWGNYGQGLRTTDAHSGNYALVLSDWYGTREDYASLGEGSLPSINTCLGCGAPIDFRPLLLKGYYKFALLGGVPSDSVTGGIEVYMTRYDSILLKRDTIGEGAIVLPSTPSDYSMFEMPIDYSAQDLTPDTIFLKVSLAAASSAQGIGCGNCMYFYIDGLELLENATSTGATQTRNNLNISPNPAKENILVVNNSPNSQHLKLYNMNGNLIDQFSIFPNQNHLYNLSELNPGFYFLSSLFDAYKIIKLE